MLIMKSSMNKQKGVGLTEFMISITLSMAAIAVVFSIYVTTFTIDTKTIRYSRLVDEVNSLQVLITEDIKRAGYVNTSEDLISIQADTANTSRCYPDASSCSNINFRDIDIAKYGSEDDNSCILFAYDWDDDGSLDLGSAGVASEGTDDTFELFGYRINDGAVETRKGGNLCTEAGWEDLTDIKFVTITDFNFNCSKEALNADGSKKVDLSGNVEIEACTSANLPPPSPSGGSVVITVEVSFTATLVDDPTISLTASEKVTVRNAFYN